MSIASLEVPSRPTGVGFGPVAFRVNWRAVGVSLLLAGLAFIGLIWNVSVGDYSIPFSDVFSQIVGLHHNGATAFIINDLRLPRALTAVLVGAAFGISGQIFQRLVNNPLASPDILGISAGASAAAVGAIVLFSATTVAVTGAALGGAIVTVVAIYLLAYSQGLSSYRIVLIGIGMTAMGNAMVAYLLTRAELVDVQRATVWLVGSLSGRGWEYVRPLTLLLVVLLPLAMGCSRQLQAVELGDDIAVGLGMRVNAVKLSLGLIGAALAAVATAAVGPIAFVALVSPQIARRLVGPRSAALIPAALVGAVIVVYSDLLARRLFAPTELPVGVFTAVVGAPYLLWLLARVNKIGTGG